MVDEEFRPAALIGGNVVGELASQRTELSFEQAAMSSDTALLAAVRTSMAMIAFGFIIFEFLQKVSEKYLDGGLPAHSPRRFALALIVLGVMLLCLELISHTKYGRERRRRRHELFEQGLVRHQESSRTNSAMIVGMLLLIVGILAIVRVALSAGPL
jgi:putative membrane protein